MPAWKIEGQYMETCNCSYVCPCIVTNMAGAPTEGRLQGRDRHAYRQGREGRGQARRLSFIVVMLAPGPMAEGNIKVGLIVDDKANEAQAKAIGEIATGAAGGPMEALGPLVGEIAGVEMRPITFEMDGLDRDGQGRRTGRPGARRGLPSPAVEGEPLYIDNAFHPVASRLAMATATRKPLPCLRHRLGRRQRPPQRPLCALRLVRLASTCRAGPPPLRTGPRCAAPPEEVPSDVRLRCDRVRCPPPAGGGGCRPGAGLRASPGPSCSPAPAPA